MRGARPCGSPDPKLLAPSPHSVLLLQCREQSRQLDAVVVAAQPVSSTMVSLLPKSAC